MVNFFTVVGLCQKMLSACCPLSPSESILFGVWLSKCHLIMTERYHGEMVHLNIHFRFDHDSFHLKWKRKKPDIFNYLCWGSATPPSCFGLEGFQGQVNMCLVSCVEPVLVPLFPMLQEGNSCCLCYLFWELSTVFGTMGIYPECFAGRHLTFHDDL